MIGVAVVVALFVLFIGVRFALAVRAGYADGGAHAKPRDRGATPSPLAGFRGPERERNDEQGVKRLLDADRDRRRNEEARRAAEQVAANSRRMNDDLARRSRDRQRAETERVIKAAVKRGRGW